MLFAPAARCQDEEPFVQGRKLSEWLKMLQEDPEVKHRRAALLAVQFLGPKQHKRVLSSVTTALRDDSDEKMREMAAATLGHLSAKALKIELLEFKFDTVRDALASSLRGDKSAGVREAAAKALGRMEKEAKGAVGALAGALKDSSPAARAAAADALLGLGAAAREALPDLRQVLQDKGADIRTREKCARALGLIGAPDVLSALPAMQDVITDPKAPLDVRKAVAEALYLIGRDAAPAAGALGTALTDKASDVSLRRAAAAALDAIGPDGRDGLPALEKALKDDDRYVRSHSMHAVGRYGKDLGPRTKDAVTALLAGMNDSVLEVRIAAIETLGVLGPEGLGEDVKAVTERLTDALKDSQQAVRDAAAAALKKIQAP